MKKLMLLFPYVLIVLLTGCGTAKDSVAHRDGNLIITNYASSEITDITITHQGESVAVSKGAIQDTQLCYFTIDPADDYTYTVSFVDHNGEEHAQEFTDQFTKDTRILIAVHCTENVWTMDYDK